MNLTIIPVLAALGTIVLSASTAYSQDVKPLIEAERRFCRRLTEAGLSKAFAEFLVDEGIIFRPAPVNGKEFHTKNSNEFRSLLWEPEFAEMSLGNDFGYTTGPWKAPAEVRGEDTVYSYGHYITVWQLSEGQWKALIDGGISYLKKYKDNHAYEYRPADKAGAKPGEKENSKIVEQIGNLEKEYSQTSSVKGEREAFEKYASDSVRLNRANEFPILGKEKSLSYLGKNSFRPVFNVMGIKAAPAGDLAFSYGTGEGQREDNKFSFMKIWKMNNDRWEIVVDLMLFLKK